MSIDLGAKSDLSLPCDASISRIEFRDGVVLTLEKNDTVIFVGANNSGKSETLRSILSLARGATESQTLRSLEIAKSGSADELIGWLKEHFVQQGTPPYQNYSGHGLTIGERVATNYWDSPGLGELAVLFIRMCRAESRITDSNTPAAIAPNEPKQHPLHWLYEDDELEDTISTFFREAFGQDLVINWRGGSQLPIHVGKRPIRTADSDRVSNSYTNKVKELPLLQDQGDGMRAFATLLFAIESFSCPILLVDEPEAFLHPPQARRIGELMARSRQKDRQLFIATHSTDVLRGILSNGHENIKIVRLERLPSGLNTRILLPIDIEKLWNDPILRFSNALDGLFHEATVLCEGDSDCRFYEAMAATVDDSSRDTHFAYTAGKDRLPVVRNALKALGVSVAVVADFDILQQDQPLKALVDGNSWSEIIGHVQLIRNSIEKKSPTLSRDALRAELITLLNDSAETALSDEERDKIRDLLRGTSLWSMAKGQGKALLSGDPAKAANELLNKLAVSSGVFVVAAGELESFCRIVGGHGPRWVAGVLKRNLKTDPELREARSFVSYVTAYRLLA